MFQKIYKKYLLLIVLISTYSVEYKNYLHSRSYTSIFFLILFCKLIEIYKNIKIKLKKRTKNIKIKREKRSVEIKVRAIAKLCTMYNHTPSK